LKKNDPILLIEALAQNWPHDAATVEAKGG
jgi:hypothetical protein